MDPHRGASAIKIGLAPIARSNARLFILGSLPGDASLAAGRYYAHPRNQFWRLVGAALGEPLHDLDYDQRIARLGEIGIGLWDVIGAARRRGSLDGRIRDPLHNGLAELTDQFPRLEAIAFNGAAAAAAGRRLIGDDGRLTLIDLPSSSPANTRPLAEKQLQWNRIAPLLGREA